ALGGGSGTALKFKPVHRTVRQVDQIDRLNSPKLMKNLFSRSIFNPDFQYFLSRSLLSQAFRCAIGDNFSFVNDQNAIACRLYFGEDVGAEDDRFFLAQFTDQLPDLCNLIWIKSGGGFVQYENFRVMNHRLG